MEEGPSRRRSTDSLAQPSDASPPAEQAHGIAAGAHCCPYRSAKTSGALRYTRDDRHHDPLRGNGSVRRTPCASSSCRLLSSRGKRELSLDRNPVQRHRLNAGYPTRSSRSPSPSWPSQTATSKYAAICEFHMAVLAPSTLSEKRPSRALRHNRSSRSLCGRRHSKSPRLHWRIGASPPARLRPRVIKRSTRNALPETRSRRVHLRPPVPKFEPRLKSRIRVHRAPSSRIVMQIIRMCPRRFSRHRHIRNRGRTHVEQRCPRARPCKLTHQTVDS